MSNFPGDEADHESPEMKRVEVPDVLTATLSRLQEYGLVPSPGQTVRSFLERIERLLVEIDLLISRQLNAIIHNPRFKKLDAAWQGLRYLVNQTPVLAAGQSTRTASVRINIFQMTLKELVLDLTEDIDVDGSVVFEQVYTNHYGTAGGQPMGLLIGNYEFEPTNTTCDVLTAMGQVAAAAFCPFVTGASPEFWGVNSFAELQFADRVVVGKVPARIAIAWNNLRSREDSRFLGLAVPRVLMRKPYGYQHYRGLSNNELHVLRFEEDCEGPDLSGLLWGSAAWAFGEVAIREFLNTRWFGEMLAVENVNRQVSRLSAEFLPHGIVINLPELSHASDREGLQPKPSTDLFVDETLEEIFVQQGFLTLAHCPGGPYSAFFSAPSIQVSRVFDRAAATENAKLSSTLDAMLCVSRFAHYVKSIGRDWLGSFNSAEELEERLHNWVMTYVSTDTSAEVTPERRAEFPLTSAAVKVVAIPGKHGAFKCQMQLRPRLTPDGLVASIRLMTEFVSDEGMAG